MQAHPVDYRTLFLASGLVSGTLLTLLAVRVRKLYPGLLRIVVGIDLVTVAVVVADLSLSAIRKLQMARADGSTAPKRSAKLSP